MRHLLPLVCAGLLCAAAQATSTREVTVTCPVCDTGFKAREWQSTNSFGGVDHDFLEHAAGGQVFIIACWTCPRCCYTGFQDDFDPEKAPKELIAKLKEEKRLSPAEPIDPGTESSDMIPAWIRYDLYVQELKLAPDATPGHLSRACLRTAHTQRFGWEGFVGDEFGERLSALIKAKWEALPEEKRDKHSNNRYDIDMSIGRALETEAGDPKSGLDAASRLDAVVAAAFLYKSRGEDQDAVRVLAPLAVEDLPADLKTLVTEIRIRIERERKYQQMAIPFLEKELAAEEPESGEASGLRYLLGVLYRRTGDTEKAIAKLEPLLADDAIPEGFKEWIRDEIAKAKRK